MKNFAAVVFVLWLFLAGWILVVSAGNKSSLGATIACCAVVFGVQVYRILTER